MELRRVLADAQGGCDLLVPEAARDETQHVELAIGKGVRPARLGGRPRQLGDDPGGRRRRDRRFPASDRLDHRSQLGGLEVLEQIATGTDLDGLEQVVLVLTDGEHDDPRVRLGEGDATCRLEAAASRHPDIHEHEVGLEPGRERDRLLPVTRRADHVVAPRSQERGDAVTEERVVVGQEDAHQERT